MCKFAHDRKNSFLNYGCLIYLEKLVSTIRCDAFDLPKKTKTMNVFVPIDKSCMCFKHS